MASAQAALEGRWAQPAPKRDRQCRALRRRLLRHGRLGERQEPRKGVGPGTRVLSDLRPQGGGIYKGRAYEPKRGIGGSATVRQIGARQYDREGLRGRCGLFCKEQRWTRVS